MRKNLIYLLTCIVGVLFLSGNSLAGVVQANTPPEVAVEILDFIPVDSVQDGNISNKTYQLEIRNTGSEVISNMVLTLIHSTGGVVIGDKDVVAGDISPGETTTTTDTFSYSIDMGQQTDNDIEMTWQVEYVVDGESVIDEVLVANTIL